MQSRASLLEQMLRISEKQLNAAKNGDVTILLEILARKQRAFEMFEELERQLDPHRNVEPQDRQWDCEQDRLDCDAANRQCKKLLEDILTLDTQSEAELARQKDEAHRQLQVIDTSGKAATAYARQNIAPVSPKKLSPERFDFTN